MSQYDAIMDRLEEGREKLGGFGEPVWSAAMTQLRMLEAEREELIRTRAEADARCLTLESELEKWKADYAEQRQEWHERGLRILELEAERDRLREALEDIVARSGGHPRAQVYNNIARAALTSSTQEVPLFIQVEGGEHGVVYPIPSTQEGPTVRCLHEHVEWVEPHRGKCLDCGVKIVPLDELPIQKREPI